MHSFNYRAGMITAYDDGTAYARAYYYDSGKEFKTVSAAKAYITREHNAWRKEANAEHYARLRAIWEQKA